MCPPGGALSSSDPGALKQAGEDDNLSIADETKDKNVNFCSLQ